MIFKESIKTPKTNHTKITKANIAQGDKPKGLDKKTRITFASLRVL
jgi:hypothetical protein